MPRLLISFSSVIRRVNKAKPVTLKLQRKNFSVFSKKMMIYGRAYFKGDVVGELTDIGFSNVDEVISELVKQLPKSIPIGI